MFIIKAIIVVMIITAVVFHYHPSQTLIAVIISVIVIVGINVIFTNYSTVKIHFTLKDMKCPN